MSKKKKKLDLSGYEDRAALCPHFDVCGGCTLQRISYEKQLKMKAEEVTALLEDPPFEGIIPSPSEEGYRNKMEFTFGDVCKGGEFALGLHMRGSFMNIVNITDCHLVHEDINAVRNTVRNFFNEYYINGQITFHNNKTHKGYLRHLLIRRAAATGEILVALVTSSDYPGTANDPSRQSADVAEEKVLEKLMKRLLSLSLKGQITGILHIVNDGLSDTVRSDRTDILYGRDYIYDEVLGLRFKISVFSFFQTNTFGAERLYSKAREYAADAKGLLFDLYSGTGTIAQLMSVAVDNVIGVEIVSEAVDAARENAELNGITNARFVADDVLKALDTLPKPDSIILDPPREGINPKALGKILSYGVDNIVYVSCKPSSLARDLQSFKLAGYQIEKSCCVDMFPQTQHVETVVLMSRNKE
jgi:23S rRNA (uracil1939-C5)-methyltransferase